MLTADYGGTGGKPIESGLVVEEPDIEIGAGVSSKGKYNMTLLVVKCSLCCSDQPANGHRSRWSTGSPIYSRRSSQLEHSCVTVSST